MTVTSRAQLDPCAAFFVTGDTEKLVYCPTDAVAEARCRLGAVATVADCPDNGTPEASVADTAST